MSLNDTMARLSQSAPKPPIDEPMIVPDEMPTVRDLATALFDQKQGRTCKNCIRRERGDCPSKSPMPKKCFSFQLNSKQMATYGQQAKSCIAAWRKAIEIHAARTEYAKQKRFEESLKGGEG